MFVGFPMVEIIEYHGDRKAYDHQNETQNATIGSVMHICFHGRCSQDQVHQPHTKTGSVKVHAQTLVIFDIK